MQYDLWHVLQRKGEIKVRKLGTALAAWSRTEGKTIDVHRHYLYDA